ncbi:MAG: TolC family protein [Flavobacteriales bacterium]
MKKYKFLLPLLLLALELNAQDTLTFEQAVEIALKNNHSILISKNDAEINRNDITPGNAGMLPQVNINAGGNYAVNNTLQDLANGTSINKNNALSTGISSGIALNWTIFDGMKMFATYDKLKQLGEMGELSLKMTIESTISEISKNYYSLVKQAQLIKALENDLELYRERVKIAEAKFNMGSASKVDLLQAKVDMNELTSNYLRQKNRMAELKAELNHLMARSIDTPFEVSTVISTSYNPSLEDLKKTTIEENYALRYQQKNIMVNELALKEVRSQLFPKLGLTANYNFTQSANQAGFILLNQNLGLNTGVVFSWNLFNGGNDFRQIQNTKLSIANSKLLYDESKMIIETEVLKAYNNYKNAKEILALEEENYSLAKENVEIALERFRLGSSSSLELKQAQKSFEDAQLRLVTARYDTKIAETELMRLNGTLVK